MIPGTAEHSPLVQSPQIPAGPAGRAGGFGPFLVVAALLLLAFSKVLVDLANYAFKTSLYSHVLLIPFISGYLVWQERASLPKPRRTFSPFSLGLIVLGIGVLLTYFAFSASGTAFSKNDYLSFTVFSFTCFFAAAVMSLLGTHFAHAILFPLAFLIFLVPFPDKVADGIEIASQYASAEAYSWLMDLSRASYFREGRIFHLPNLTIEVAQECSGIRSSFVLFITSLIAGHMFLRSPWKKAALALAVFPLGIVRNAFRIYLLSMLSIHWDPDVIHSPLHHSGGPIFFALSLIPFFLFLLWLRRSEAKQP